MSGCNGGKSNFWNGNSTLIEPNIPRPDKRASNLRISGCNYSSKSPSNTILAGPIRKTSWNVAD